MPRNLGAGAMAVLGARCGAVVEDPRSAVLYFFVPTESAQAWEMESTRVLSLGSSVTIPPHRRTEGPGPHWRMCPGDDGWLTEPNALRAALEDCTTSGRAEEST
ncbi:hypothetical protein ABZX40_13735 [Streptomyces sp. NPDC004610]|uniref:hypothetical protein n=1 Tax=unclassified Streptomyces TaxID=2593676 RepID=UPI0033B45A7C